MQKKVNKSIESFLITAVTENHSAFAWKSFNGVVEKCMLKIKAIRKEVDEVEFEIADEFKLTDLIDGKKEISFYIPDSSVSFISSVKKVIDEKKFKINIPKEFEFFDRRNHERVKLKKSFCYFEGGKLITRNPLHDLSIGGFALVLPLAEKTVIKKGKIINDCVIEINGKKIKTKVECVSSITINRFKLEELPYGGYKIAFRFLEISKEDKMFLVEAITMQVILNKQLKGA